MAVVSTSEGLFTLVYNRLIKRKSDPKAFEFMLGFDSEPILAEKSLFDLAEWTGKQKTLRTLLLETDTEDIWKILQGKKRLTGNGDVWDDWVEKLNTHLDAYGHATFNLDFMNAVVADDPRSVIDTIKFFLSGKGTNPHTRQKELAKRREEITEATIERLGPIRRRMFQKRLKWAQETAPHRENSLAAVGLGWPLLRRMLGELGERFVSAGVISHADDVYWLEADEVKEFAEKIDTGKSGFPEDKREIVETRKIIWRGQKRAIPPQMISSKKTFLSWIYENMGPSGDQKQTGNIIKGLSIGGGMVTRAQRCCMDRKILDRWKPGMYWWQG